VRSLLLFTSKKWIPLLERILPQSLFWWGVGKRWNPKRWLWRHLAGAAQTADSLHAVGPAVWAVAARWRQSQRLRFPRFPTPYRLKFHWSGDWVFMVSKWHWRQWLKRALRRQHTRVDFDGGTVREFSPLYTRRSRWSQKMENKDVSILRLT